MRYLAVLIALGVLPLAAQPTYTKEVSRILQAKCQTCHREGDIAPYPLKTYEDAVTYAADIQRVIEQRLMPPWKPVEGHGSFRDSYALTVEERETLLSWIRSDTPLGDPADLPEPLAERGEWSLGEPDLVLKMPEPFTAPRGRDIYRCFVLPTGMDADKFVTAVDVLPGNRQSVHHVILFLDTTGEAEKLDAAEEGPGYTCYGGPGTPLVDVGGILREGVSGLLNIGASLGGWAPGTRPHHLPEGVGMFLDKRARVVMQVHYYTTVSREPDQTRVGLYFAKQPVERRLVYVPLVQTNLNIPAGNASYTATAQLIIPPLLDSKAVHVFPHMHLLGRDIKVEVERPLQPKESMIWIDNWDFNWQGPYTYTTPVSLPAFSRVRLTCTFDNSEGNPRNPNNPLKNVKWGEGTEDEMCLAFLGLTFDRENLLR